jgi:transcriptional regulator with XRE-family HTH domain
MAATLQDLTQRLESRRKLPPPKVRRAIRLAAGASQADVGEVVGVTRQSVSLWEAGSRTPRGGHLDAYLDVLRTLRDLAVGTPETREAGATRPQPLADNKRLGKNTAR